MLKELIDLINSFSTVECLIYRNATWNSLVEFFKFNGLGNKEEAYKKDKLLNDYLENEFNHYYNSNDLDDYTIANNAFKLSKLILLFSDVNSSIVEKVLLALNDRLLSANKYIYMSSQKIDKCLFILNNALKLIRSNN